MQDNLLYLKNEFVSSFFKLYTMQRKPIIRYQICIFNKLSETRKPLKASSIISGHYVVKLLDTEVANWELLCGETKVDI